MRDPAGRVLSAPEENELVVDFTAQRKLNNTVTNSRAQISQRQDAMDPFIGVLGLPRLIWKEKDEVSGCLGQKKGAMNGRKREGRSDLLITD